ncbi:hypothetical protein BGZ46_009369 [Entomortierella lignicola]|nr:hypothetical protein BGZ46_009369 [Entomortierella lignicola]
MAINFLPKGTDAEITEIESRLVQRKPVEAKLVVGDSDVSKATQQSPATAVEKAMQGYESAVKIHLVNVANEASTLQSFYGSYRFKQDKYVYQEALRHDLDKATAAILQMRKHVPARQPSDERLMDEVNKRSGIERETLLKFKSLANEDF